MAFGTTAIREGDNFLRAAQAPREQNLFPPRELSERFLLVEHNRNTCQKRRSTAKHMSMVSLRMQNSDPLIYQPTRKSPHRYRVYPFTRKKWK
jgi:hypothetical protein